MEIEVVYGVNSKEPYLGSEGAGAYDLYSANKEPMTIKQGRRLLVPTKLQMAIPDGYILAIKGRSGLALKGIDIHNGTIDSDYRGDIGVIVINNSEDNFTVEPNMRIAQCRLEKNIPMEFKSVEQLPTTERSEGGFGHSGLK